MSVVIHIETVSKWLDMPIWNSGRGLGDINVGINRWCIKPGESWRATVGVDRRAKRSKIAILGTLCLNVRELRKNKLERLRSSQGSRSQVQEVFQGEESAQL